MLPPTLNFGTRGIGVVNCRPWPLCFRETIAEPIGGTERRSVAFCTAENGPAFVGIQTSNHPFRSLITIPTELSKSK